MSLKEVISIMKLQQVIYAVEVFRQRSYTKAAQALYVSQPRLSKALKDLEEELGFEIFQRTRHGIRGTTTKGYAFIKQAQKVLQQYELLQGFQQTESCSLQISTTLVTQAQKAFQDLCIRHVSNPHLDVELWFAGCYETAERIRDGLSDIGIVTILRSQLPEWKKIFNVMHLSYTELTISSFHVTLSANSPLRNRNILSLKELRGYTYITEKCSRMNDLTLDVYTLLDSICPEARITVSNTDIMYQLLQNTSLNRTFVLDTIPPSDETLSRYNLVSIPIIEGFLGHLGYITRQGEELPPLAKEYLDLLRERLGIE